jgi:hypothetical protein
MRRVVVFDQLFGSSIQCITRGRYSGAGLLRLELMVGGGAGHRPMRMIVRKIRYFSSSEVKNDKIEL